MPTLTTPKRFGQLKRIATWATFFFAMWLICSFVVTYRMTRRAADRCPEPIPNVAWGRFEPFRLTTQDGEELGAWFVPGRANRPVLLLLHGFNGPEGRRQCLPQAELFAGAGYSVLMITMRAHGDSTGSYNDIGYAAQKDVIAAVGWLERHHRDKPIIIHGQSMGAAAALFAADELGERVAGYIIESPYQDLRTAVWNRTKAALPTALNAIAYGGLLTASKVFMPHLDRISPIEAASAIPAKIPVLVLAGEKDELARPEEAQAIAEQIAGPTQVVIFEGAGAGHSSLFPAAPKRYSSLLLDFAAKRR